MITDARLESLTRHIGKSLGHCESAEQVQHVIDRLAAATKAAEQLKQHYGQRADARGEILKTLVG